jgi:DNA-directed RNA polymerase specialized sigma24 family protein
MAATSGADAAASFDPLRPRLMRIAYRMLGSVADAEDVVQDAFLRCLTPIARRFSNQKLTCAAS